MPAGNILIVHVGSGLDVAIWFELGERKFYKSWSVTATLEKSEDELYRDVLWLISKQFSKWLAELDAELQRVKE